MLCPVTVLRNIRITADRQLCKDKKDITSEVEENKDEAEGVINRGIKYIVAPRRRLIDYVWGKNAEIRFQTQYVCLFLLRNVHLSSTPPPTHTHTETESTRLLPYLNTLVHIFIVC